MYLAVGALQPIRPFADAIKPVLRLPNYSFITCLIKADGFFSRFQEFSRNSENARYGRTENLLIRRVDGQIRTDSLIETGEGKIQTDRDSLVELSEDKVHTDKDSLVEMVIGKMRVRTRYGRMGTLLLSRMEARYR